MQHNTGVNGSASTSLCGVGRIQTCGLFDIGGKSQEPVSVAGVGGAVTFPAGESGSADAAGGIRQVIA